MEKLNISDQVLGENIKHNISERLETLDIYGLKLRRETDIHENIGNIIGKGCSYFYLNDKPIIMWDFDPKTGKLTIIDDNVAYNNGKFKPFNCL